MYGKVPDSCLYTIVPFRAYTHSSSSLSYLCIRVHRTPFIFHLFHLHINTFTHHRNVCKRNSTSNFQLIACWTSLEMIFGIVSIQKKICKFVCTVSSRGQNHQPKFVSNATGPIGVRRWWNYLNLLAILSTVRMKKKKQTHNQQLNTHCVENCRRYKRIRYHFNK